MCFCIAYSVVDFLPLELKSRFLQVRNLDEQVQSKTTACMIDVGFAYSMIAKPTSNYLVAVTTGLLTC